MSATTASRGLSIAGYVVSSLIVILLLVDAVMKLVALPVVLQTTADLGGAVATHVRVGSPLLSHVLFGVYLGVLLWGGLYLRDGRIRELMPLRR